MVKSKSIPIPIHPAEIRIRHEEERKARMVEYHDRAFYNRMVAGLKEQQEQQQQQQQNHQEADCCERHQQSHQQRQSLLESISLTRQAARILSPPTTPSRNYVQRCYDARMPPGMNDLVGEDESDLMFEMD
eukprot:scaffold8070_cov117-Cylindrotheca_fusiformis.AAC.7